MTSRALFTRPYCEGFVLVTLVSDPTGVGRPQPWPVGFGVPRAAPPVEEPKIVKKKKAAPKRPKWPTPKPCPRGPGMKNGRGRPGY